MLKTITSEHQDFQQISIHIFPYLYKPLDIRLMVGEEIYQQWMDLDNTLVRLCESRGVRMKAAVTRWYKGKPNRKEMETVRMHIEGLLPQMTEKSLVDPAYLQVAHKW